MGIRQYGSRAYLSRDAILGADDVQAEDVDVPEWGGAVRVRGMSGAQRDAFEASLIQQPQRNGKRPQQVSMENIRAKLCAWCIVNDGGERLFTDDDIAALGAKSGAALSRVFDVAMRLSGMSAGDVDELAEAMVENPFGGSSSA